MRFTQSFADEKVKISEAESGCNSLIDASKLCH